jgi:hypothetical protein
MNVYCRITYCDKFIFKDYDFIPLLIDVKLSSSSKGYLCKSSLREGSRNPTYVLIEFL